MKGRDDEGQRCKQVPNVDKVVRHCYSLLALNMSNDSFLNQLLFVKTMKIEQKLVC